MKLNRGTFLSEMRKKRGLSQNDIASSLGYSPQLISLWEKDKASPDLAVIGKYAQILCIDLDGFLNCVEQKNNDNCVNKKFDISSFSLFIRALRKEKGLLQNDVASTIGVNVKNVGAWENMSSLPSLEQFISLCKLFNLSYDELYFCYKDEKKRVEPKPIKNKSKKNYTVPITISAIVGVIGVAAVLIFTLPKNNNVNNKTIDDIVPPVVEHDNLLINTETHKATYGYYPQSKVTDQSIIDSLNATATSESYELNGDYYKKFGDKWFKYEEINWIVVSQSENKYTLVSEKLLDVEAFYNSLSNRNIEGKDIYPTNYEYSDIRTWLNDTFFNSAFSFHSAHIQSTLIDNSISSTDGESNPYTCSNTEDKVFLLSYQQYRLLDSTTRRARHTEYSVAKNGYNDSGYGYYWTRSPYSNNEIVPWCVDQFGELYTNYGGDVTVKNCSVRPAIVVTK